MKRLQSLTIRIARLFGPTVLLFLIAEASARFFVKGEIYPLQPDPVLNHIWRPNFERIVTQFTDRGVATYRKKTNSQSWLAAKDFPPNRTADTYRVVYMGDSFTEGTCDDSLSVPTLVERGLHAPEGKKVEVINTGTSSYSPTLYYLLLKTKILDLSPDLVVVNVDMTDVFDDSIYRATLEYDQEGEPVACPPGHPAITTHRRTARGLEELSTFERILNRVSQISKLVDLLLLRINQERGESGKDDLPIPPLFAWCSDSRDRKTDEDIAWSMSMLRRVIQLAHSRNIKIVVTGVPHLQQLQGIWSMRPMDDLKTLCEKEGVPFLNPSDDIRNYLSNSRMDSIYIPDDMHFNPKGYELWARSQIEFLNTVVGKSL